MQIRVYRDYSGPNPRPTSHSHTGCLCFSSSHPVKKQHAGLCGSVYNNPVIWVVFNSVLNSTLAPLCLCCHEFLSFALSHVWKLNFPPPLQSRLIWIKGIHLWIINTLFAFFFDLMKKQVEVWKHVCLVFSPKGNRLMWFTWMTSDASGAVPCCENYLNGREMLGHVCFSKVETKVRAVQTWGRRV